MFVNSLILWIEPYQLYFFVAVQVAEEIRHLLNTYEKTIPTVLEIPSKDSPYDPAKDYIMKRVNLMLGES